jgi:hypothetical protein
MINIKKIKYSIKQILMASLCMVSAFCNGAGDNSVSISCSELGGKTYEIRYDDTTTTVQDICLQVAEQLLQELISHFPQIDCPDPDKSRFSDLFSCFPLSPCFPAFTSGGCLRCDRHAKVRVNARNIESVIDDVTRGKEECIPIIASRIRVVVNNNQIRNTCQLFSNLLNNPTEDQVQLVKLDDPLDYINNCSYGIHRETTRREEEAVTRTLMSCCTLCGCFFLPINPGASCAIALETLGLWLARICTSDLE